MIRLTAALLALALACLPVGAATLLPPGMQTFTDQNGRPLAGGSVSFYLPNTTTVKQTWKDPAQTVLNTNPVKLDAAGRAVVYGAGAYRMVVKDQYNNLIYDQLTADTSSSQIAWGGTSTGSANGQIVSATNFTSADGQIVGFIAGFTNTGQLTVSANGSGSIPVLIDSQAGPVNLTGQEVVAGSAVLLVYDAGRGAFHLVGSGLTVPGFGGSSDLAAGSTVDLSLAPGHVVNVTGNGTISSFGASASATAPVYLVRFSGSAVVKFGAAILTPGGADIYAQPGGNLIALYLGSGNWRVLFYSGPDAAPSPAGQMSAFAAPTCPAGWLFADGSIQSRSQYPRLFAAMGTVWGSGDGSTTFAMPDARGMFLRGWDGGRGFDPGRGFATNQSDALASHSHTFATVALTGSASGGQVVFSGPQDGGPTAFGTSGQNPAGGNETRPKNIAVIYCIRY
ncbi:tail fiber protein [Methylobacterium sp. yr596]|uniref:tail fiber protein n=1 Tax=Methylobacterium sp. yr596 TaxID=1761800 RepID=UPI0008E01908|nr:tail fiber protein [Methylobacterium sp. yr596]SFF76619.1 Microcystin-dependent protein [Methylobacterium sp. yr596]